MEQLTIGNVSFEVVTINKELDKPLLLLTEKQQEFLLKNLDMMSKEIMNDKFKTSIFDFRIEDGRYACNAIKNYLNNHNCKTDKVIYLDGFLKIVVNIDLHSQVLKQLNIPHKYVYFHNDAIMVDLGEYEYDEVLLE